jgi:hypothetical protein
MSPTLAALVPGRGRSDLDIRVRAVACQKPSPPDILLDLSLAFSHCRLGGNQVEHLRHPLCLTFLEVDHRSD